MWPKKKKKYHQLAKGSTFRESRSRTGRTSLKTALFRHVWTRRGGGIQVWALCKNQNTPQNLETLDTVCVGVGEHFGQVALTWRRRVERKPWLLINKFLFKEASMWFIAWEMQQSPEVKPDRWKTAGVLGKQAVLTYHWWKKKGPVTLGRVRPSQTRMWCFYGEEFPCGLEKFKENCPTFNRADAAQAAEGKNDFTGNLG